MEDSQINNDATCLLCCQQRQIFILPKCNHKHICWRCCINMIKQGNFGCPFCKSSVNQKEKIIFVTLQQMLKYSYNDVLKSHQIDLLKSSKNSNYFYSNQQVAQKIEYETNYNCPFEQCEQLFDSLNQLKKHLDIKHKKQYCDICLNNRKCIQSQQILYSDTQYQRHIKNGQFSQNGDLILFHPTCTFCKQTFYDIDQFRRHLELAHQKCYICHKSSEQLKYVYFDNYQQAVQHFKKSHFYCQISTCLGTKFQNVFVTEQALNQHVLRVHKKAKKNNQPIMNIMLGFNKNQQQSVFQWDKIGKNFASIFQMVQKSSSSVKLQVVQHEDLKIDIRDFYPEQVKRAVNMSLIKIKEKIEDKMFQTKYKDIELYLDDIDFFKPLQMQPLTKVDLQKFLSSIFDKKYCDPIITKFFTGRQQFNSADQYFGFVKDKMKSFNKIAYYYAFPQLIRFYKNDNPHKQPMDQYYYQTLRDLKVKKPFIIHTKQKYSQVLQFMKYLIQKQMQQRDQDSNKSSKQLDIQKYINFLKDSSLTYYVKNQQDIFYVSKQKMTNLYHMINKCKVQDFLKMNWLLKIGFSNQAYKIIWRQFYYREEFQCYHAIKKLNIQQLAYLYAYCNICLQSIFQKNLFKIHKQKPLPLFLTELLGRIKRSSTHQRMSQLIQFEKKFFRSDHISSFNKDKGIIINAQQHPSLLDRNIDVVPFKSKPPDKQADFPTMAGFGTVRPKLWNEENNTSKGPNKKKVVEQYPSILTNDGKKKKQEKKVEQQQFPVFHYIGKKQKKQKVNQSTNLNDVIGWGGSGFVSSKWNQETSLKNWQKRQQDEKRRIQRQKQIQQQNQNKQKVEQKVTPKPKVQEKTSEKQSKKQKQKKIEQKVQIKQTPKKPQQPMVILVSKRANKIDEEQQSIQPTKKKNKNKKNKEQIEQKQQKKDVNNSNKKVQQQKKQSKQQFVLFEQIQKESQIISKKNKQHEAKLQNFFESADVNKKQQKQKIPSKSSYIPQNYNYQKFDNHQFPQLQIVKPNKVQAKPKDSQIKNQQQKAPVVQQTKPKKKKKQVDDTSSQDQKKAEHKKSDDFVSISDKFQKQAKQKVSMVNQIIQQAKVQEKPQNLIKVKTNKKGKKEIIQRVNLANLW